METKEILIRFLILQDPIEGKWCVIHDTGILVGDEYDTYEEAFCDMLRIGSKTTSE